MQDAVRPLRLLLGHLARADWAPLDVPLDELIRGPGLQLAGFSPDPFAVLAPSAVERAGIAESGAPPRARPRAATAADARGVGRSLPGRSHSTHSTHSVPAVARALDGPESPAAEPPPWRPRPASPGLPQRVPMPWPALPKVRPAPGLPTPDVAALRTLTSRFAPAVGAPPLDAAQLRALAMPRASRPPASTLAPAKPAAMPHPAATVAPVPPPPSWPAAAQRPLARPPTGMATGRRPLSAAPADGPAGRIARPEAGAIPVPRGRASALAELLQRWPGEQPAGPGAPTEPVAPLAAEVTPRSAAPGAPLSIAELPAAFGAELPRPQALAGDLQFARTLERVLLAEVRRHGLEPDAS